MTLAQIAKSMYDSPPRAYHNWGHVEACLAELSHVRDRCDRPDLVEIAIWFHDAVYDPTRNDNEQRSAHAAAAAMKASCSVEDIAVVRHLILDTRHAAEPATNDGKLIVDIDLAILGQPPAAFAAYEAAIRQEYAHVADADFAKGRAAVLRKFLDGLVIYRTGYFHKRYEEVARQNLLKSLTHWRSL
jgi:predicted metal-dependent HD superfamily phosphohydrolase